MSLVAKIVKVKQAGGRGGLSKYYSTTKMTPTPQFCKGESILILIFYYIIKYVFTMSDITMFDYSSVSLQCNGLRKEWIWTISLGRISKFS